MNIFVLDDDITKCAEYHCDQHAIKMILESVQLLCTALNKKGFSTPYKSTHAKHPCVLWVEASYDNFEWLVQLTLALNAEYRFRFDKTGDHKSIAVLSEIDKFRFERLGLTPFAQANGLSSCCPAARLFSIVSPEHTAEREVGYESNTDYGQYRDIRSQAGRRLLWGHSGS